MSQVAVKKSSIVSSIFATGLAMFSMFFGAGNIVFPLAIGLTNGSNNFYAVLGMVITAVLVPLAGLLAMLVFEGDYEAFFRRVGRLPGFVIILVILGVIGPFGGIPRCIANSYATLGALGLEGVSGYTLPLFSLVSCALIYLFTFRPNRLLPLLGYVLTPLLLLALGVIAVKGLWTTPGVVSVAMTPLQSFTNGFLGGYNTMDLLASFFFSSVVLRCLRKGKGAVSAQENRSFLTIALWGSLIAAFFLTAVYVAFSFLAAGHGATLANTPVQELLGTLAYLHLGPYAGLMAGIVVSFACLTTEIALAAILADYLHKTICKEKISYSLSLLITLGLSFAVSTLRFEGIAAFLGPFLIICYPALIALTFLNIAHKLWDIKRVKSLFYLVCTVSLCSYFLT